MAKRKHSPTTRRSAPRPEVLDLLEQSKENPREDGPRLKLADWLEKNGSEEDAARAELIRVQCRLARLARDDSQRGSLIDQEKELVPRAWPLGEQFTWRSVRGLLHISCLAATFVSESLEELTAPEGWAWVETLRLIGVRREVCEVADSPLLAYPTTLDLSSERLNAGVIETLSASPRLTRLRTLNMRQVQGIEKRGVQALAASPSFPKLTTLILAQCSLREDAGESLAALALPALTSLDLSQNVLDSRGAASLARSPGFTALTHLDLSGTPPGGRVKPNIDTEGLRALVGIAGPAHLVSLELADNDFGDPEARILAKSPRLANLTHLGLNGNRISNEGVAALAASPHLSKLVSIDLRNTKVRDKGLLALAGSSHLSKLARVRLDVGCPIGADAWPVLEKRFGPGWET